MSSAKINDVIRQTVQRVLPGARIVLFGSRVNGDYDVHSDYDLLVITSAALTSQEKINWSTRLDHAIVKAIMAPVDLLLYSEEEIKQKKDLPGNIVRTALREGISI